MRGTLASYPTEAVLSAFMFCYGTLEIPEILNAVAGFRYPGRTALLHDYARYCVRGEVYPAVIREPGACTRGTMYTGITSTVLRKIDAYEGGLYQRRLLSVHDDEDNILNAWTYVVPRRFRYALSTRAWDRDEFVRVHLPAYMNGLS